MAGEAGLELRKTIRAHDDKFDYFLLAAAGASIAYAMNQVKGMALSWSQICLGVAVLSWGLSFYFGCERLAYVRGSLAINIQMNDAFHDKRFTLADRHFLRDKGEIAFNKADGMAAVRRKLQYGLLIFGGISYICWQVNEMYWKAVNT
ncbi:hypothetical protein [Caulobacter sp. UC70_42]|uniref:hypothetical protein n=1 Tax=Caulobacter sp. UC70_42 TaxID=3374551 RepID=UPI0037570EEE